MNLDCIDSLRELAEGGTTPLHLLGNFRFQLPSAAFVARALLDQGEDPNGRNSEGMTPLHVLAEEAVLLAPWETEDERLARLEVVRVLLQAGADPWAIPVQDEAALYITPAEAFPELVSGGCVSLTRH